ncbi:hypothetical protein GCM10010466_39740 [Planomonospora alba]|uniref:Uncharacterized protein n=1 Tax=Planomonospora alba TaxID=161354 RepID=A0ABP6NDI9_9ACTN
MFNRSHRHTAETAAAHARHIADHVMAILADHQLNLPVTVAVGRTRAAIRFDRVSYEVVAGLGEGLADPAARAYVAMALQMLATAASMLRSDDGPRMIGSHAYSVCQLRELTLSRPAGDPATTVLPFDRARPYIR